MAVFFKQFFKAENHDSQLLPLRYTHSNVDGLCARKRNVARRTKRARVTGKKREKCWRRVGHARANRKTEEKGEAAKKGGKGTQGLCAHFEK